VWTFIVVKTSMRKYSTTHIIYKIRKNTLCSGMTWGQINNDIFGWNFPLKGRILSLWQDLCTHIQFCTCIKQHMALQEAGGTSVLVVYVLLLHPRSYRARERESVEDRQNQKHWASGVQTDKNRIHTYLLSLMGRLIQKWKFCSGPNWL